MSGRKNTLQSYQLITSGDMSSSITSAATNIQFLDNIGVQLHFTGSPTGTFSVQVSLNHKQDSQGVVSVPGDWVSIVLSPAPVAAGSADDIYIDINQISSPWLRVVYTRSSGSGTLQGYVGAKEV